MPKVELRLVSRKYFGFENALRRQVSDFESMHSELSISLDFLEVHDLYEQMVVKEGCRRGQYDMMLVLTDWLPQLMKTEALSPINVFIDGNPPVGWPGDWTPSLRKLQTDARGNFYGLAYHDGPEVFHYRSDLFADPLEKKAFRKWRGRPLRVPRTWSEFLEVAKFFTRPRGGLWGTLVAAYPDAHNNVYDFIIQLYSRGGRMFDDKLRPRFNGREGVEGLQFYVDLIKKYKVAPPECLDLDSVASGNYYAQGNIAMMWNWIGFAAVAQMPSQSNIVGKNVCTIIPKGDGARGRHTSINVYYIMAVTAGSRHKDEAYLFLKYASSPMSDRVTSFEGGTGTRISTWKAREIVKRYPFYPIMEEVHRDVESPPAFPEYAEINEILNDEIRNVTHRNKAVVSALNDAAVRAGRILGSGHD